MVFEFLESVFDALTKWSDAPNPPVPEGPFASVDERKGGEEGAGDQD
ncbi:hypothetical protein ABZ816_23760 [Actinosynnema sp. NPDC047251]|uniref:Uncharacterized protein n=1 Tax=Saccharothrix espanaensis (strain ATCC 51144 / DSM 44229 / JCM 9112 / NBRC 15066 / NRRL 15764) TaxID=1179773 RepID=K0K2G5_SACES|nr:hypothetical protein [Saccharothrix espanaensis]CCH32511.1 hypothetical protein BN6_52470 [Saccharothrix espanaensis DSM 44229]